MNVKAKKIFTAVLLVVVLTVLAAGAASARGWGGHRGGRGYMGGGYGPCGGGGGWGGDCGAYFEGPRGSGRGGYGYGRGYGSDAYANEVPQEIRDKITEAQKISIDLRNELSRNPVNRERALELHKRHGEIMQEISDWRFQQRLEIDIPR